MTWDITLESPSYNATNAGTQILIPVAQWQEAYIDADQTATPQGGTDKPLKSALGMYRHHFILEFQITAAFAQTVALWAGVIIKNGAIAGGDSLRTIYLLRDLLADSFTGWWNEAVAGNWHNDGTPARQTGQARLQLATTKTDFAANLYVQKARYIYGKVIDIQFAAQASGKDNGPFQVTLTFEEAQVASGG